MARLSQEELARRLNRTQSWVSKAERGERRIDVIELRDFCCALKQPLPLFVDQFEKALARERRKRRDQVPMPTSYQKS